MGNRTYQIHNSETTSYIYQYVTNQLESDQLVQTLVENPEQVTTFSGSTVSTLYRAGERPSGKSLQEEWQDIIIEAGQILDDADRGRSNRRYNNLVGKFNSFLNHSQFERKLARRILADTCPLFQSCTKP